MALVMILPIVAFCGYLVYQRVKHGPVATSLPGNRQLDILPPPATVSDAIRIQKERERREDRAWKEYERKRKQEEQERKAQEEARAAADRVEWLSAMIEKYIALSEQIETELESNTCLTEYKRIQLQRQLLTVEEKIRRYHEQRNKAYFTANK